MPLLKLSQLLIPLIAVLSCGATVVADTVFKCTIEGKIAYQAQPCKSVGKQLSVSDVRTPEQIADATKNAQNERQRLQQLAAQHSAQADSTPTPYKRSAREVGKPADCKSLTKDLTDAWGRRNNLRRNHVNDSVVSQKIAAQENAQAEQNLAERLSDIQHVKGKMARAGCKIDE